jgi:hypothetical protein
MQGSLFRAETLRRGAAEVYQTDEGRKLSLTARAPHDSRLSL